MKEFSVQHYMFRPLSNEIGFVPMLGKLAAMGYSGVEMCCFGGFGALGMTAGELAGAYADNGMKFIGNHFTRDMFDGPYQETFDYIAEAGGRYAMYNVWRAYDSPDAVAQAADFLNGTAEYARRAGITLVYHNHGAEFVKLEGRLVIDRLLEQLDPDVMLEHDVFFARQQGTDVCEYIRRNAERIRLVHLKQIDSEGNNVDLPDGIIDMRAVIDAATNATDFIVEQASFRESIMESLRVNAEYLKAL